MNDDWFGPLKYTKETRSQEVSNCVLSGFFLSTSLQPLEQLEPNSVGLFI